MLVASAVPAQSADLDELLSGKSTPLTVKLGNLDKEWRRITIRSVGTVTGNISVSVSGNQASSSAQNNIADLTGNKLYLTRGKTASVNGQTYLIAYRLPGTGTDLQALVQAVLTKSPPTATTLTPETALPLSLLDLKTIGSLDDIRAFDMKQEIAESEKLLQTITNALKAAGGSNTNTAPTTAKDKPAQP